MSFSIRPDLKSLNFFFEISNDVWRRRKKDPISIRIECLDSGNRWIAMIEEEKYYLYSCDVGYMILRYSRLGDRGALWSSDPGWPLRAEVYKADSPLPHPLSSQLLRQRCFHSDTYLYIYINWVFLKININKYQVFAERGHWEAAAAAAAAWWPLSILNLS